MRRFVILANVNGTRLDPPASSNALSSVVAIAAMPGGASRPGRAPSCIRGRAQNARTPPGYKGPAMRPRTPPPNPICVQNVKITPKAK